MNILFLNWRDRSNPRSGGAEVVTEEIAKRLAAKGHHVTLMTSRFFGSSAEEFRDGYHIVRRGREWTVQLWAWRLWLTRFRSQPIDVVVDEIHGLPFFTPLYIRRARIVAFIHEVAHDVWLSMYRWPLNYLGYWFEPWLLKSYARHWFVTGSLSTARDLTRAGIAPTQIHTVLWGIPFATLPHIPRKENAPTLVYVGRLVPSKQVDRLLTAYQHLTKQYPNLQLWILGQVVDKQYFSALLRLASGYPNITFHGYVSEQEKIERLSKAWLFVSASAHEGFGLAVIEAAACATPAVTYDVAGYSESVQDGTTGLLSKDHTVDGLAATIANLIQNQKRLADLQRGAWEYSHSFDLDTTSAAFEKILEKAQ